MKTLKQIADEIGVPKQQVYRYVRAECINEVHHEALEAHQSKSVKYYDESAENTIKAYFQGRAQPIEVHHEAVETHHDAHHDVHQNHDEVHHEAKPESLKSVIEAMQAGHAAEVKRLVDQLDQLRQDHREELDRIQAGHAAEVKRLEKQIDDMRAQLEEVKHDLTEERQHSRDTAERLAQLADQAQRLQLAQMQPPAALPEEITPQDKPPTLWQRIFGKK